MNRDEALGAFKVLRKILKEWDRVEYDGEDFIPVGRLEEQKDLYMELYKLQQKLGEQ